MPKEVRSWSAPVRRNADEESGVSTLISVAPPWETLSVDLGGFREKFARGAFKLDDADVVSTFEHRNEMLLGRTPKTLELIDTEGGLEYRVELPDTQIGRDLAVMIDRGDVSGSSFEFSVHEEDWDELEDGTPVRTVTQAKLFQVGPVTWPAYRDGTDVALRSLEKWREDVPAKTLVSLGVADDEQRLARLKERHRRTLLAAMGRH